jgi:glycosyltransferase involved in cell wall biosynthesis
MSYSILIPVYNTLVADLVNELHKQATELSTPFEIILIDDCSDLSISYLNLKLKSLGQVSYTVLPENIGRAKIRNLLFEKASYDNCIIMDGDVGIDSSNFIQKYIQELKPNLVVCGGHKYKNKPPEKSKYLLHWLYGSQVEALPASERSKKPYSGFKTVCFAIQKSCFEKIKFEESVEGYGHEDTLFGIALKKAGIEVKHIENPVVHLGVDDIYTFLDKQKQAVQNLKKIYSNYTDKEELESQIKLLRWAKNSILVEIASKLETLWMLGLEKKKPSLRALQMLKLAWWKAD